ncbi:MAG: GatB/YqeY domain-containing protein [Parcubacteria group bacterium]|nr:GatB/YqeY domain-containing protein [Parcubacteria group bacterium]
MILLTEKINADMKAALKSGDRFSVGVLRMALAAIHNQELEKRRISGSAELSDSEVVDLLFKEVKKRREAAELFNKGGRGDLAEKEEKETEVLKKYLPAQLGEEEVAAAVEKIIAGLGAVSEKDFGKIMGAAVKELKGKADSSLIGKAVKAKLGAK